MNKYPFNPEKETKVIGYYPAPGPKVPMFDTPITPRENLRLALSGERPLWIPTWQDLICLDFGSLPDNVARGGYFRATPLKDEEKGGKDMFGTEWVYVPVTGGSMVKPGNPRFTDANEWKNVIEIPNPDEWNWAAEAESVKELVDDRRLIKSTIPTGLFERLISFMDFSNALLAIIDEDQKEAVHELFDTLCGVYEKVIDNMIKYLHIDMLEFHDDWGSQRAPLFSADTIREMILPYLKRIVDYCHERGVFVDLHSCGKNETLVPVMIEAGVDLWIPQQINDCDMLIKTYGDKIMIGMDPDVIAAGTPEEECKAMARRLVEKYIDNPRVFIFRSPVRHMGKVEYDSYFNELYISSRELLSK